MTNVAVVIPVKQDGDRKYLGQTLKTLQAQTYRDFRTTVVFDQGRGASWARNKGVRVTTSKYILFSDDDVLWKPDALGKLVTTLEVHPEVSIAYGPYAWIYPPDPHQPADMAIHHTVPPVEWDPAVLRLWNYVSTMSLVRRHDFIGFGFDENLTRLQDWDLWLRMAARGNRGKLVSLDPLFQQIAQPGIRLDSDLKSAPGFPEARQKLVDKGLLSPRVGEDTGEARTPKPYYAQGGEK